MMEGEWVMVWVMVWNRVRMEDESVMVWVRDLDRVRRDGWMDRWMNDKYVEMVK
jgi:hypothetical protein